MKLDCYSYQLPFKQPLTTSNKVYDHRKGLIFRLADSDFQYYGEAAPLPGFSTETLHEIQQYTNWHRDEWARLLETEEPIQQLQAHYLTQKTPSSLQFGLDSLAYQLEARRTSQSLSSLLFEKQRSEVAVNGLISLADNDDPISAVRDLQSHGFGTIKCKIGQNFDREHHALTNIRDQFPDLRIRLDANRAWSVDKAAANLAVLESLDIEYCEEPLSHPTPTNYSTLFQQLNLPLALDESVNRNEAWETLLPYCSALIIKPMVVGSFSKLFAIRRQAQKFDCSLIFTSSLESSIGRTITAILAAGLGSSTHAHGLNTGELLAQDIISNQPEVRDGSIHLDAEPQLIELPSKFFSKLNTHS